MNMKENFKEDLRIVRTVKLLKRALFDLLKVVPYDKISVIDVCDKALVHRTTFYKHFENKDHLLMYALEDLKDEVFNVSSSTIVYDTPKAMYMYLARCGFDYISNHKASVLAVYKNLNSDDVLSLTLDALQRSIRYMFIQNRPLKKFAVPIPVMSSFFTGGIVNLIIWWLNNDIKHSKEEMLNYLNILLDESCFITEK
jgi:hypothetical protein